MGKSNPEKQLGARALAHTEGQSSVLHVRRTYQRPDPPRALTGDRRCGGWGRLVQNR